MKNALKSLGDQVKLRYVIMALLVVALVVVVEFFRNYPSLEQVRQTVESILMQPDRCQELNPKMVAALKSIQAGNQRLYLEEKNNAMPIRVDYHLKDGKGKVVGELAYRVDAGCRGLSVTTITR